MIQNRGRYSLKHTHTHTHTHRQRLYHWEVSTWSVGKTQKYYTWYIKWLKGGAGPKNKRLPRNSQSSPDSKAFLLKEEKKSGEFSLKTE